MNKIYNEKWMNEFGCAKNGRRIQYTCNQIAISDGWFQLVYDLCNEIDDLLKEVECSKNIM